MTMHSDTYMKTVLTVIAVALVHDECERGRLFV
jgi:hypothetical protein